MSPASVLIADDHLMFAEPNGRYLALHYEVFAPVLALADLAPALGRLRPDVLLLDISFGRESSLSLLATIARAHPAMRIVIVTGHADPDMLAHALRDGASGYVVKDSGPAELLLAIETVLSGAQYVTPELRHRRQSLPKTPTRPLTERQRDVFLLLRKRFTLGAIASALGISVSTVEKHVLAIKRRYGLEESKRGIEWDSLDVNASKEPRS
jgi:DNA-binding NarL/FixJ family response regulator